MSIIRTPVHLLMVNNQFEKIETFEFWDPTVLKVSYRPYAIQHTVIALVAHIPVVLLLHSINLFSNAFSRHRSTIVFSTHGLLLFTFPQYLFYACLALLVWDNTHIPIGVCSIVKNFTSYLAQTGYNVIPVVAFYRYLNVVWQFRAENTLAWLSTLIVAVPNIGLAISSTFFGLPTPGEICAIIYLYHSNSSAMMIQSYMLILQLAAILLHLRVALYLRRIDPGLAGSSPSTKSTTKKRPQLMVHAHTLNVVVQKTRTDYCITLALLLHSFTILAAMIMQSVWGLEYMNAGYVVKRSFALDLIDALPIAAPGFIALFSLLAIRESRTYVRQLFKRAKRGNPRIVTSAPSVSIVEKGGFH